LVGVVDNVDMDGDGKVKYHYVIVDYLVHVVGGNIAAASCLTLASICLRSLPPQCV
jgi:hypothetical protein